MNPTKRVVFTMGGKGGVGKTGVVVALAEWFEANQIPVTLLDLDTENKARGSLKHFFNGAVTKVNINTPAGLDAFVDHLEGGASIIVADMGAGAGQIAADWFDSMYEDVSAIGVTFTAVGVVTPDPASVESLLAWANRLQDRVDYVVVENATSAIADFTYWNSTEQAHRFREAFSPEVLHMEFRLAELENPIRQHGVQLGQVADRKAQVEELKRASLVMRAQSYRRRLFSEFDGARAVSPVNTIPAPSELAVMPAGESTTFDSLARLVPDELQAAYYRVLAYTRGLSPDDEMLRILEAMGILALLTRHTPKDIAEERERLQELLETHQQYSEQVQQNMLAYVHQLESRLTDLPGEIEAGLDPKQIAKMLGESLRQHFLHSGVQDTVSALQATGAAMTGAQKELSAALHALSDSHGGVVAQVERANNRIEYSLECRKKTMDALLLEWKSDLLRIWIPMVAAASMLIGLFGGVEIQGCRDSASPGAPAQSAVPVVISPLPKANNGVAENPNQQTGHSSMTHGNRPRPSRTPGR